MRLPNRTVIFFKLLFVCINAGSHTGIMQSVQSNKICLDLNGDVFENINEIEVNTLLQQSENPRTEPEQPNIPTRPQRRSKQAAMARMQEIREWENCSENSTLFRQVADAMDKEFENMEPEEQNDADDDMHAEYKDESESSDDEGNLSFVDSDSDVPINDDDEWSGDDAESESEMSTTSEEPDHESDETEHTYSLYERDDHTVMSNPPTP